MKLRPPLPQVGDRGEYANDAAAGHVRGYDTEAPGWGQTAEQAWGGVGEPAAQGILTRGFVAGGFVWTGFDYKGEPTPYSWPDINSHFGILDMAGFPKDRAWWYTAWWAEPDPPSVHVFPHWNWDDADGADVASDRRHLAACAGRCRPAAARSAAAEVDVWVYSNAPEVELFLNNASLGRQAESSRWIWAS